MSNNETEVISNFIRTIIDDDLESNKYGGLVHTRFPPEPSGYLHIGHAKAICLSFGIAEDYTGGKCNLRFDDTNPCKEETEYVDSIKNDINWLGFDWENRLFYASDYFETLCEYAIQLIRQGDAYVCDLSAEEIREYRGTLTEKGRNSPYRDRSIDENIELFEKMRRGEFNEGECVLRAKIDMSSGNLNMRDPVMYRIMKVSHHRTGSKWCIYPTYDFTHGQSDSIEHITHSLCDISFEAHRPLYDWFINQLGIHHPQQIEFARLNITYTVLSKRFLRKLVEEKYVTGWNDPRMPTLSALRRKGYTSASIRKFCNRIGVAKRDSIVDIKLLENTIREELNLSAPRVLAVLDPLKVTITNFPDNEIDELDAVNNPEDPSSGSRKIPFTREIFIEKSDFLEDPPRKFFRLAPGREVRLRYAYYIKCEKVIKDETTGEIKELHCSYDPATRGGYSPDGRKVKGTIHWVSAKHALNAEVRFFENLFTKENPLDEKENKDFTEYFNPDSLKVLTECKLEPGLVNAESGEKYQFERQGYFCVDNVDSKHGAPVFNRIVPLRDSWAKISKTQKK